MNKRILSTLAAIPIVIVVVLIFGCFVRLEMQVGKFKVGYKSG